jgi:HSP20 family protein
MTTHTVSDELVELDAPFAEFFRTLSGPWPFRPLLALAPGKHFIPTADVFARNGDFVVRMDLPGMSLKDIHVKFEAGDLAVTGERKLDNVVKEDGYYRKESSYGFFERHVSLPKGVKENDIKAVYDNGVLEISIPRPTSAIGALQAKTIAVTTPIKPVKV